VRNATINSVVHVDETGGAWELDQGEFSDDEFAAIVKNFTSLASENLEPFLVDHGAVYNKDHAVPESYQFTGVSP